MIYSLAKVENFRFWPESLDYKAVLIKFLSALITHHGKVHVLWS